MEWTLRYLMMDNNLMGLVLLIDDAKHYCKYFTQDNDLIWNFLCGEEIPDMRRVVQMKQSNNTDGIINILRYNMRYCCTKELRRLMGD
jgi:hypothetical protein